MLKEHFGHTWCNWIEGVTAEDVFEIMEHVKIITNPGSIPDTVSSFNTGYRLLAADVNKDDEITIQDARLLKSLLLGNISSLPAYEQPWLFVHEFITQNHSSAFHADPFNLVLGGQPIGTTYLEPGWQYNAGATGLQQRGLDAIKIGDVNSSWPYHVEDCAGEFTATELSPTDGEAIILQTNSNGILAAEKEYDLVFEAVNFADVRAF